MLFKHGLFILAAAFTLATLTFPAKAQAQLSFEPWIGYETGNSEVGGSSDDLNGYDFGLKVAYEPSALGFGVEYGMGKVTVDQSGSDQDLDLTDIGLFARYRFSLVRVWFGYLFNTSAETDGGGEYDGTGIKLGLGVSLSDPVTLNFEKVDRTFDELNGSNLGTDVKTDTFILSLGLEF